MEQDQIETSASSKLKHIEKLLVDALDGNVLDVSPLGAMHIIKCVQEHFHDYSWCVTFSAGIA